MAAHLTVAGRIPEWSVADHFRKARESAGLSQMELAEISGISRRTIVKIEGGGTARRPDAIAWAMATGVSLEWLLPRLDSNQQPSDYRSGWVRAA